jgi:hypothetical protein
MIVAGIHRAVVLAVFAAGDDQQHPLVGGEPHRAATRQAPRVLERQMLPAVRTEEITHGLPDSRSAHGDFRVRFSLGCPARACAQRGQRRTADLIPDGLRVSTWLTFHRQCHPDGWGAPHPAGPHEPQSRQNRSVPLAESLPSFRCRVSSRTGPTGVLGGRKAAARRGLGMPQREPHRLA